MRLSWYFFILLSSTAVLSSLEALPPADDDKEAIRCFHSIHHKEEETSSPSSPSNPFDSAEDFGFESLKGWDHLSSTGKKEWQEENVTNLKSFLSSPHNEEILTEGARKGFFTSMLWLGKLKQDQQKQEEAFSWYALALWTQLIRGNALESIQAASVNPWNRLKGITLSPNFSSAHKAYFTYLENKLPSASNRLGKKKIIEVVQKSLYLF